MDGATLVPTVTAILPRLSPSATTAQQGAGRDGAAGSPPPEEHRDEHPTQRLDRLATYRHDRPRTGGLGLTLGSRRTAAQDANAESKATHPIVGTWLVAPRDPNGGFDTVLFGADGSVIQGFAASAIGPSGVGFTGPGLGTWEPTGPRSVAFTAVSATSDAAGTNLGTVTLDGHPDVREDGKTWIDDAPESTVTIRDKGGAVVMVVPGVPETGPVIGTRIVVTSPGFSEGAPEEATPMT